MKDQLMHRISDVMVRANKIKDGNMDHSYLWTDSRTEYMYYFLTYARQLTHDEVESIEEEGEGAVKKKAPSLDQFKEQIDFYEQLHEKLKHVENLRILQVFIQRLQFE